MEGKKNYLQPKGAVLEAIHDIVELLRGRQTVCDTPNGKISTHLTMYGYRWDVGYTVKDIGKNRCTVTIEINGDLTNKKREIRSAFALLDSILLVGAEIEFVEEG